MKNNFVQFAAILLTGLVAGLLFGYSCSVVAGLGDLSAREYILAFQSINRAILNPYFFSVFFGSPVILVAATYKSYKKEQGTVQFNYLLAASLITLLVF